MDSILHQMLALWKNAAQSGIPPEHITFQLNKQGMKRYLHEVSHLPRVAGHIRAQGLKIEYVGDQEADVTIKSLVS